MKTVKQTNFKVMSPNSKKMGILLLSLIGMIVCFLFATKIGFSQITVQRKKIKDYEKNIVILEKKLDSLSQVQELLSGDLEFFSLALPDTNPAFSIIYQVKKYSSSTGLLLENMRGGVENKGKTFSRVDINFDLNGNLSEIISFLKLTQEFSPIVTVENLKLTQGVNIYRGSVGIRGYWAALPKNISALTQPLSDFTDEERDMIVKISELLSPPFTDISPQENPDRLNPFE